MLIWDRKDRVGEKVKSGVYFILISNNRNKFSQKVIIVD